jgi:hypothetical protein
MGWLLTGAIIAGLAAGAFWVFRKLQDRGPPGEDLLLQVTATREVGHFIAITVEIRNQAPSDLHVHAIGLIEPVFGELVMLPEAQGSQIVSAREITLGQTLPPKAPGVEDPYTIIKLALDDPGALCDTICLTAVVSRRADRRDLTSHDRSARVWLLP